jgi:hypothetical protein
MASLIPSGVYELDDACWTLSLENGEGPHFEGAIVHYLTEAEADEALLTMRTDCPDDKRIILLHQEDFKCWEGYARCGTRYVYDGDMETWHFPSRHDVEYTMSSYGWTAAGDGTWMCDNEKCAGCHPDVDPLFAPVPQVAGQLPFPEVPDA